MFKDFEFVESSEHFDFVNNFHKMLKKSEELNESNLEAFNGVLDKLENFLSILKGLL